MAKAQRATLADRLGTGSRVTPAVPAQTSAEVEPPAMEQDAEHAAEMAAVDADVNAGAEIDAAVESTGHLPGADAAESPADIADMRAEFNAYRDAADTEREKRDEDDPFGAALGHAVLISAAKKSGKRFNVETIPASIRKFVERSHEEFHADEVDGIKLKAKTLKYRIVPFATAEDAKKFVEYAKKFGLHREAGKLSVRAYIQEDATKVKVAVSPYATRGPKKADPHADVATEPTAQRAYADIQSGDAKPAEPTPETPAEF